MTAPADVAPDPEADPKQDEKEKEAEAPPKQAAAKGKDSSDEPPAKPPEAPPPDSGLVVVIRTIDKALAHAESAVLLTALLVLILAGILQPFTEAENKTQLGILLRYLTFVIGMIGAALAAQSDRLINLDLFTRIFPPRGRLVLRIFTAAFTVYVCWLLIRGTMPLRHDIVEVFNETVKKGERTPYLGPQYAVLALPVGAALISVHMLLHSILDVVYIVTGRIPAELVAAAPKAH